MLAISEGVQIPLAVFQLIFSGAVSFMLWKLASWQRERDRKEDTTTKAIEAMQSKLNASAEQLHQTATRLVDERFRAMSHELNGHVQGFVSTLDEMKAKVKEGEEDYRSLGDRDQRIELNLAGQIDKIKDFIREYTASREDMRRHEEKLEAKVNKVEGRIGELGEKVAVLSHAMGVPKGRSNG